MAKKPNYRYTVEVARQYKCSGVARTTRFTVVLTLDEFSTRKAEYAVEKLVEAEYRYSNSGSYEHEYNVTKVEVL